jgi:hypothetical protein
MEVMSYTERLRLVRSWNQMSGSAQRGSGLMSSKRDVGSERRLSTFYVVERVRRIVGELRQFGSPVNGDVKRKTLLPDSSRIAPMWFSAVE